MQIIDADTGVKSWIEDPPDLREGEREVIWINQDESLFYATDDAGGTWQEKDKNYIQLKGLSVRVLLKNSYYVGSYVSFT